MNACDFEPVTVRLWFSIPFGSQQYENTVHVNFFLLNFSLSLSLSLSLSVPLSYVVTVFQLLSTLQAQNIDLFIHSF